MIRTFIEVPLFTKRWKEILEFVIQILRNMK